MSHNLWQVEMNLAFYAQNLTIARVVSCYAFSCSDKVPRLVRKVTGGKKK